MLRLAAVLLAEVATCFSITHGAPARTQNQIGQLPADMRQRESGFTSVFDEHGSLSAALRAVWRSRGYGFVIDLAGPTPAVFIEAGNLCWRTDLGKDRFFFYYSFAAYRAKARDETTVTGLPGGTLYTYDRVAGLPPACREQVDVTPGIVFDALWGAMNDRYGFFQVRGIDWSQRRDRYRSKALAAASNSELYDVLKDAVSGFRDGHLRISGIFDGREHVFREVKPEVEELARALKLEEDGHILGANTQKWRQWLDSQQAIVTTQLLSRGATRALNGHMIWGLMDDNIGYIGIDSMLGYGSSADGKGPNGDEDSQLVAAEMDRAVNALAGASAVIIDVSENRGGDDRISRVIASRFADEKRLAYTKHARGGTPQSFYLYPAGPRRFLKPVYLLTSRLTGSAAEVFALAMRALPNTCQVGESTGGAFSDALETPLPNGWVLTISNEIYLDPEGDLYESKGAPPKKPLEVFPLADPTMGQANAIRQILGFASSGKGCAS